MAMVTAPDPLLRIAGLTSDQEIKITFDGVACFILETPPTQKKYLQCDTRVRTEWSFRVRPGH